jgi:hypothetical protein
MEENVNRRALITTTASAATFIALPKLIVGDVGRENATPSPATPEVTPTESQDSMMFERYFGNEDGGLYMGVKVIAYSDVGEAMYYFQDWKEYYEEGWDDFYLSEEVKYPHYGEEGYLYKGKVNADTYNGVFVFREGLLMYVVTFGAELDTFRSTASYVFNVIKKVIDRTEFKETYTDQELYDLLPTEEETGYVIVDEEFTDLAD